MPTVCVQLAAAFSRLRGPCVIGVCRSTRGFSVADSADLFQVRTEVVCHHAYDCRSNVWGCSNLRPRKQWREWKSALPVVSQTDKLRCVSQVLQCWHVYTNHSLSFGAQLKNTDWSFTTETFQRLKWLSEARRSDFSFSSRSLDV